MWLLVFFPNNSLPSRNYALLKLFYVTFKTSFVKIYDLYETEVPLSFQIFAMFKITALKLFFNVGKIFCSEKIKQTESLKHMISVSAFIFQRTEALVRRCSTK